MPLALYRRYRPQTFADLVGQETTAQILQNAARQNRLGHAYLFYGPRGTGKTTIARLLTKLLNCERRQTDPKFAAQGEPCNVCRNCTEITAGISLDVMEIDAASNRGIDEIRNLKDSIRVSPSGSPHKIYIIDEAHMLTGAAFNALLKTLEEPPPHGVLILATTEYEKLPATITSRTQRFLFKKASKAAILDKLRAVAAAEKVVIEPAALELIAAAAEGSFRDAESLLDQLATFSEKLDLATVEQLTGRVGLGRVEELTRNILNGDLPAALGHLAKIQEEGASAVQLTRDLIHYFRKVIALAADPKLAAVIQAELTAEELARAAELAKKVSPERHAKFVRSLIRAYAEMRYSPFALIPLELALVEHLQASS